MNTDSVPAVNEPLEPDSHLFAFLDGYWEALRQGVEAHPRDWQEERPGSAARRQALRALAALDEARRVLNEVGVPEQPDAAAPPNPPAGGEARPLLEPGTRLGECRIVRLLGSGGMGEVYLAEHELLRRNVAVKLLPARLAGDRQSVRRFRKSVEILARLDSHPHIAPALHASIYQDRLYLVLEFVPGVNLQTVIQQQGPLPVDRACVLMRQVAETLGFVHRQGIVHRDIKPANLMLTPAGTIKILDLGLARLVEGGSADVEAPRVSRSGPHRGDALAREQSGDARCAGTPRPEVEGEKAADKGSQTGPGNLLGTLDYIAPEQARDARRADARSDLYSLGCTFFFLLTGRPPFAERSDPSKVVAHAWDDPPAVRAVRPDVPDAVSAIVHRLLAKRPEDRYQTGEAVVADLERFLSGAARLAPATADLLRANAPAPGRAEPLSGPTALPGWGAWLTSLASARGLLALVVLGLAVLLFRTWVFTGEREELEAAIRVEQEEQAEAAAAAGHFASAARLWREALAERESRQRPGHWQARDAALRVERYLALARWPSATQQHLARGFRAEAVGQRHLAARQFREAETAFRECLGVFVEVLEKGDPNTTRASNHLAACLHDQGDHASARVLAEQVLANVRDEPGENHPDTATSCNILAVCLHAQGRYRDAEPWLQTALKIRQQRLGEDHPDTAASYNNLAVFLQSQDRYAEAEQCYRRAFEIHRRTLGPWHPDTAASYSNLASCRWVLGPHTGVGPRSRVMPSLGVN
jgi:tetratricopeptide (TPR) repeat protein